MKDETKEVKVIDRRTKLEQEVQDSTPNAVILKAMEKNYSPELIEKMMDLHEKHEKRVAEKAYFEAVSLFKENPPQIIKDMRNTQFKGKDGKGSGYASLGNLLNAVNPELGKYGLSVSYMPSQSEGLVTITCKLSHRQGHSESVTMTAPPDTSGGNSKNPIQQIKSTFTYLRAMTFEAVTGLSAIDEANFDDDGNAAYQGEFITEDQVSELSRLVKETGMMEGAFMKSLKVGTLSELTEQGYKRALGILNARKKQEK